MLPDVAVAEHDEAVDDEAVDDDAVDDAAANDDARRTERYDGRRVQVCAVSATALS